MRRRGLGHLWAGVLITIALCGAGARAFGDGAFFKEMAANSLEPKPVGIPEQRTLISYRDGVERLVVESTLDSEGQSFGWILPVPAAPTRYETVSPGLLINLSNVVKPEWVPDGKQMRVLELAVWLALAVTAWAYLILTRRLRSFLLSLVLLPVFVVAGQVAGTFFSVALRARTAFEFAETAEVVVEDTMRVGNYDVYLLNADKAEALNEWLQQNDFTPLPEAGVSIARDYIRDGWRFVASKLRREGSGICRPHPLAIVFPAAEPVYPMRLTALAESDVQLELFIVADGKAAAKALTAETCDTFRWGSDVRPRWSHSLFNPPVAGFRSEEFQYVVAHSEGKDYLWDGCCLTRLVGKIAPSQMKEDITFAFSAPEPYRLVLYSRRDARYTAIGGGLVLGSIFMAIGMLLAFPLLKRKKGPLRVLLLVIVPAVAAACAAVPLGHSRIALVDDSRYAANEGPRLSPNSLVLEAIDVTEAVGLAGKPAEEAAQILRDHFEYVLLPYGPDYSYRPQFGELPGGVDIGTDGQGVFLRAYDGFCVPAEFRPGNHRFDPSQLPAFSKPEGFEQEPRLIDDLFVNPKNNQYDRAYWLVALYGCAAEPEKYLPVFQEHLRNRFRELSNDTRRLEVSVLALATRTPPPRDSSDYEQVEAFMARIAVPPVPSPAT